MAKHVVVCLDETGSMYGQEERVVKSLNDYVAELPHHVNLTVFKFGHKRWVTVYEGDRCDWKNITASSFRPDGNTPLYDSIARTITYAIGQAVTGDKVMIVIDTDGEENASDEFNHEQIKRMVANQKEVPGWEFLFMANGIDEAAAVRIGWTGQDLGMTVNPGAYGRRGETYTLASAQTNAHLEG